MASNKTFTMIKPDAFSAGNSGAILKMIEEAGFKIVAIKATRLTGELAGKFYEIKSARPCSKYLSTHMRSGPLISPRLDKDNAVERLRQLIGATNPAEAAEGTIRKLFATSIEANAVHGSDSDENAAIEGSFSFS